MENVKTKEKYDFSELLKEKGNDGERPIRVCFVCTGNTCRSPMAAAVLNHLGRGKYIASSAGISAFSGDSISENAALALESAGIVSTEKNNYKNHFSRMINEGIMAESDKIVAISGRHMMSLLYAFPNYAEKLTALPRDISDPYMLGPNEYKKCLAEITDCIKEMFKL